jgi:glutaredoxin
MFLKLWLISLSLYSPFLFCSPVYTWTDAKGKIHYSDRIPSDEAIVVLILPNAANTAYRAPHISEVIDSRNVVLFSTPHCDLCTSAREYFVRNKIQFTELDVVNDLQARRQLDTIGGPSLPTIVYRNQVIHTFSVESFEKIYP